MKKKSISKQQREREQKESILLEKIRSEKTLISTEIKSRLKTADMVCVDVEFKEVSAEVYQEEFDSMRRNFSTERAEFRYDKCDKGTNTLHYAYTLKPQP